MPFSVGTCFLFYAAINLFLQAKLAFERVSAEYIYQPFINGPNSTTLNEIQEQTKTKINIPPYTMQKDEITIAGEKEGVAMAKTQVLKMLRELVRLQINCLMWEEFDIISRVCSGSRAISVL